MHDAAMTVAALTLTSPPPAGTVRADSGSAAAGAAPPRCYADAQRAAAAHSRRCEAAARTAAADARRTAGAKDRLDADTEPAEAAEATESTESAESAGTAGAAGAAKGGDPIAGADGGADRRHARPPEAGPIDIGALLGQLRAGSPTEPPPADAAAEGEDTAAAAALPRAAIRRVATGPESSGDAGAAAASPAAARPAPPAAPSTAGADSAQRGLHPESAGIEAEGARAEAPAATAAMLPAAAAPAVPPPGPPGPPGPAGAPDAPGAAGSRSWRGELAAQVGTPEFAPALGARLVTLVRDGTEHAQLRLHPAQLGPITVQINLDGNQARIDFHALHAATRDALQDAVPVLAGALREAGLTLAGGGVFEQPRDAYASQGDGRWAPGRGPDSAVPATAAAAAGPAAARRSQGVLDLYA